MSSVPIHCSGFQFVLRRCVLVVVFGCLWGWLLWPELAPANTIISPDGNVVVDVEALSGNLSYSVTYRGNMVIEPSPLGITVNGTNLGAGVSLTASSASSTNITFPSRQGIHAIASEQLNGQEIGVHHGPTGINYLLDVVVASNGVAFRYEFNDGVTRNITAESSSFILPTNSEVWFQTNLDAYEAPYTGTNITAIPANTVIGPPVNVQLSGTNGYVALTESDLSGFPNPYLTKMANAAGNALQVTYPVNQDGTTGSTITATVTNTPWNVIMIAANLNMLVNNDLVESLSPPPDPTRFPQGAATSWVTNGMSVWDWLDPWPGGITYTNAMTNSYWAGQLGFAYNTIDSGWSNWNNGNPWPQMKLVTAYSHSLGVKVIIWIDAQYLQTTSQQMAWLQLLHDNNVDGFKADFWDYNGVSPSAKEREQIQVNLLQEAAVYHLVVTFHGRAKPTGQFRTYPNLLQIEGIFGQEHYPDTTDGMTPSFTRFLAGPADFTPFGLPWGPQTVPYRMAQVIAMPGPIITIADRPDLIANSPFAPLFKAIPSLWDETVVLSQSQIGQVTALARRKGANWFLAVMNSGSPQVMSIPLNFMSPGVTYNGSLIRDTSTALESVTRTQTSVLGVVAGTGGGEVAMFYPVATNPPTLNLQSVSGTGFQLTWNYGTLLEATNISGPWQTNTTASSPLLVSPVGPQQFYRVQVP